MRLKVGFRRGSRKQAFTINASAPYHPVWNDYRLSLLSVLSLVIKSLPYRPAMFDSNSYCKFKKYHSYCIIK